MTLRLDRMNSTQPIANERGGPATWLQKLWQKTVESIEGFAADIEGLVSDIADTLAAAVAAQAAADAAQDDAIQALADAAAAQATASAAQPGDATLTALAGLDATAGLVEQTGADAFAKRAMGVGAATSVLTRADGDGRYAGISVTQYTDEMARDAIGAALTEGTGIDLTVNDGADTITVAIDPAVVPSISGMTAGSVYFAGASGVLAQDNSNLFWDDTNNRLGIGTNSPAFPLHVYSTTTAPKFARNQAGDNVTILVLEQANTTDGNGGRILYNTDTTGAGAAASQAFAEVQFYADTHDHATRTGHITFSTVISGTYGERLRIASDGAIQMGGTNTVISAARHQQLRSYTVAGLPSAATAGQMIYVSNETGGATPAFSDGSNWRRTSDRAVVS